MLLRRRGRCRRRSCRALSRCPLASSSDLGERNASAVVRATARSPAEMPFSRASGSMYEARARIPSRTSATPSPFGEPSRRRGLRLYRAHAHLRRATVLGAADERRPTRPGSSASNCELDRYPRPGRLAVMTKESVSLVKADRMTHPRACRSARAQRPRTVAVGSSLLVCALRGLALVRASGRSFAGSRVSARRLHPRRRYGCCMLVVGVPLPRVLTILIAGASLLVVVVAAIVGRARRRPVGWPAASPPLVLTTTLARHRRRHRRRRPSSSKRSSAPAASTASTPSTAGRSGSRRRMAIFVQRGISMSDFLVQLAQPVVSAPLVPTTRCRRIPRDGWRRRRDASSRSTGSSPSASVAAAVGLLLAQRVPGVDSLAVRSCSPSSHRGCRAPCSSRRPTFSSSSCCASLRRRWASSWLRRKRLVAAACRRRSSSAGCVLTKRERAYFLAGDPLLVALAIASADRCANGMAAARQSRALAVAAIALPWRLWYLRSAGSAGESPPGFLTSGSHRIDSLRLSLDVFFDPGLWSLLTRACDRGCCAFGAPRRGQRQRGLRRRPARAARPRRCLAQRSHSRSFPSRADESRRIRSSASRRGIALLSGIACPLAARRQCGRALDTQPRTPAAS